MSFAYNPSAFNLIAASYLAVIAALIAMRISGRAAAEQGEAVSQVSLTALKEGLRFVRRTPIIVQTMTLDFGAHVSCFGHRPGWYGFQLARPLSFDFYLY
jgi:hypothetical protein